MIEENNKESFFEYVWVVEEKLSWEDTTIVGAYSSFNLAYDAVQQLINRYHNVDELWSEALEGDRVEIASGVISYCIQRYILEEKTEYTKRLEKALLYNFPNGDIEAILKSIEKSMGDLQE